MKSAIMGTWTRYKLNRIQNRRQELQERLTTQITDRPPDSKRFQNREIWGDEFVRDDSKILDLCTTSWVECSVSLHAICKARGIAYLHALQPTLWDPGAKPITGKESTYEGADIWRRGVELGYPKLRAAIPNLTSEGVAVLDLSMAFAEVNRELYFDPCHFIPEGSLMLVGRIADSILGLLAEQD